jgi:ATP phosphoribosyltransferase regulatory subunit
VSNWAETPGILAPASNDAALVGVIRSLRAKGERVIQLFSEQPESDELGCDRVLVRDNGQWHIQLISQNGQV